MLSLISLEPPSIPINLDISWLVDHNPSIDWRLRSITFSIKAKSVKKPQTKNPFIIGAREFIRSSKDGTSFVIYETPTRGETTSTTSISKQYEDFQDVFQNKNVDMVPEHRS